jgi:hypothetical protein
MASASGERWADVTAEGCAQSSALLFPFADGKPPRPHLFPFWPPWWCSNGCLSGQNAGLAGVACGESGVEFVTEVCEFVSVKRVPASVLLSRASSACSPAEPIGV